ncbi:FH2 domain containing 3 [Scleropages formosus]|uniref:FH2 domain containing 3 n=1 Tax=Scleropages formosus TaxID=113540 RepID=A0A8C9R1X1_SCLFO|nr:FH2 domain-containing protein 1-like [Scleropages formosus]XP_018610718.1 FH2 domain-containing protein 1-like [Scleropages formosus]
MDGDVGFLNAQPGCLSPSPGRQGSGQLPVPQPPPPPPPPPPPGPLAADNSCDGGHFASTVRRQSRMRSFNWDTLPRHRVLGKRNVWTACRALEDFQLDTKRIEELFSRREATQSEDGTGSLRKSMWGSSLPSLSTEWISILSSKRSMNIGIFLKQFKRPVRDMVKDIRQGNWMAFGTGKLKELCKLLPEEEEVKVLHAFTGSLSQLAEADLFMTMLVKVPNYEERIHVMVLREEFFPVIEDLKQAIRTMTMAANELLDCDDLHSVIRLVLKAGNYMNAGGYAGSAIGFRMSSLLKLVDTKANKPGMNLMHYVAMQAQEIDVSLLKFPDQLPHIGEAARISKQEVEMDFQKEAEKVLEAQQIIRQQKELQVQMEGFLKRAQSKLAEVEASLQTLRSVSNAVAEYFCEDPTLFKLDECCSIFHSFCERFARALKENHEHQAAEARRRQQERQRSIAKRRSTATCSGTDKDVDGMALEALLHSFLTNQGSRKKAGQHSQPVVSSLKEFCEVEMTADNREAWLSKWCSTQDLADGQHTGDTSEKWRVSTGQERLSSINDKLTPKCRDPRGQGLLPRRNGNMPTSFSLVEGEEEVEENVEECFWMRETPSKTSHHPGPSSLFLEGSPLCTSRSPHGTVLFPLSHHQQEDNSPRTILSPYPSPKITPRSARRHTIAMTLSPSWAYIDEHHNLSAIPCTPVRDKSPPLTLVGENKSADSLLSVTAVDSPLSPPTLFPTSDVNQGGLPVDVAVLSNPQVEGGATETLPSSRLGHLFHRRSKPQVPRTERQESSAFISFFRRLGERGSRHGDGELDSCGTDF